METIKELENKINDVEETLNNLKAKIGVRKWNFDHALTFITER